MKIQCPQCGVKGSLDDGHIHKKIKCPKCGEVFRAEGEALVQPVEQAVPARDQSENTPSAPTAEKDAAVSSAEMNSEKTEGGTKAQDQSLTDMAETAAAPPPLPEQRIHAEKDLASATVVRCSSCGRVAGDQEKYTPSADGLLCSQCTADAAPAEEKEQAQQENATQNESGASYWQQWAKHQAEQKAYESGASGKSFAVSELARTAWEMTKGVKEEIWKALAAVLFVTVVAEMIGHLLGLNDRQGFSAHILSFLLGVPASLLSAGIMYMGVQYASGETLSFRMVRAVLPVAVSLILAIILQTLFVTVGFVLLIIPGVYLSVGYSMTLPLIIERGLTPWEAMEVSRKAIHPVWWNVFALYLLVGAAFCLSALTLFIGLIWLLPWSVVLMGLVYRRLFPAAKKDL